MPRVSVLMPVYNCEEYVQAAISSIVGQTYRDFEFIIIDDGSTDSTGTIVAAAAAEDPRIRVIARENRGIVRSLNEGLEAATGEFIARMDGDDISLPTRFDLQVKFLDQNQDHCLVASHTMLIDPDGRALTSFSFPQRHEDILDFIFRGANCLTHPTVMLRRAVALDVGGYSDRFDRAEDIDLFLRLSEKAKLSMLPDVLLHYRLHPKSIGHMDFATQMMSIHRAIVEAAGRRNLLPPPQPSVVAHNVDVVEHFQRWAWWALSGRQVSTARRYARKVIWNRPFESGSWRLLYCALRGR